MIVLTSWKLIFLICFLMSENSNCQKLKRFILEAEDSKTAEEIGHANPETGVVMRSNASGMKAVHMKQGQFLEYHFCVHKYGQMDISNIRFSNDGPVDVFIVEIDGEYQGNFQTVSHASSGFQWNEYHSSGKIGEGKILTPGNHILKIVVGVSDIWGSEIDYISVDIYDPELDELGFYCDKFCSGDITFNNAPRRDSVPSARFEQNSGTTTCSEEANVRVAIYHEQGNTFRITASNPRYQTFSNRRIPNFSGCKFGNPLLEFTDMELDPFKEEITDRIANVKFSGSPHYVVMTITFSLSQLSLKRGVDESRIGSVLSISFTNVTTSFKVNVSYQGSVRRYSMLGTKVVDPENTTVTWQIPDMTWSNTDENTLRIEFSNAGPVTAAIKELILKKRTLVHNKTVIYKDNKYMIEGTRIDFWYMGDKTMDVKRTDEKEIYRDIDLIQVYAKEPWASGYSQVFTFYHDGLVQLLPVTPHGLDWIPFGTSVIIGSNDPKLSRPTSPIDKVDFDPISFRFDIQFQNGSSASIFPHSTYFNTSITVKYTSVNSNRTAYPMMTISSMWISDGNSLVDHVAVNGDNPRSILEDWKNMYGLSATFYRKCISSYHTQSPDINVEVLGELEIP